MGAACCCMHGDFEDYANPSSNVYRNCLCIRCVVQNVANMYASLFRRGQQHAPIPTTIQGNPATSLDNSLCDMYRSPPRPLPYDADPRYLRYQKENPSHSYEDTETQPLRNNMEVGSESLNYRSKWKEDAREKGKKEYHSRSSLKLSAEKAASGFAHIYFSSSEDEDVCPTCLEEYTSEDPKMTTKCSHHFHLGCIYEWMERSDSCPVCGKEMEFNETP